MERQFTRPRMVWKVTLALCLLALGSAPMEAAKTKKPKKEPSAATPSPTPASGEKDFEVPIPINHDAKGVRIPIYNDGVLQMMFESEIAFRMDEQQLRLTQLNIETYDSEGKPEMAIDMPKSIFNLKTRVFSSVDPVMIRRTDFEITGGNMVFDTQTRVGKFTGPVHMFIFKPENEKSALHE